jgi:putative salt-induced outer membrane protein YdiY
MEFLHRLICFGLVLSFLSAASQAQERPAMYRLPPTHTAVQPPAIPEPLAVPEADDVETDDAEAVADLEIEAEAVEELGWSKWIVPSYWKLPEGWDSSFELGTNGSTGNTETQSFQTGADLNWKNDARKLEMQVDYVQATADGIENKNYGLFSARHDWLFVDSPWSVFAKNQLEYDEFRSFGLRLVLNAGLSYTFIDNDSTTLEVRGGAGASREFESPDERWVPEALFGGNFKHQLTDRQKVSLVIDYFPAWDDFTDYRVQTNASWEMLIDEATNMSLKLGIIDRYDSTPNGLVPNDLNYSLMLLWKL